MAGKTVNTVVVDTSVIVKWFSNEPDSKAALHLRDELINERIGISAPDLLLYELANALRFHPRLRAEDVTSAIDSVLAIGISFVPASSRLLHKAIELSFERKITVYDAVFAALAVMKDQPLLTADAKLSGKIAGACRAIPLACFDNDPSMA